jgi:hypothetical protein
MMSRSSPPPESQPLPQPSPPLLNTPPVLVAPARPGSRSAQSRNAQVLPRQPVTPPRSHPGTLKPSRRGGPRRGFT